MSKGFPPKTVKKEIMSLLLFLTSQGLEQQLELLEVAGLQQFSGSFRSSCNKKSWSSRDGNISPAPAAAVASIGGEVAKEVAAVFFCKLQQVRKVLQRGAAAKM